MYKTNIEYYKSKKKKILKATKTMNKSLEISSAKIQKEFGVENNENLKQDLENRGNAEENKELTIKEEQKRLILHYYHKPPEKSQNEEEKF